MTPSRDRKRGRRVRAALLPSLLALALTPPFISAEVSAAPRDLGPSWDDSAPSRGGSSPDSPNLDALPDLNPVWSIPLHLGLSRADPEAPPLWPEQDAVSLIPLFSAARFTCDSPALLKEARRILLSELPADLRLQALRLLNLYQLGDMASIDQILGILPILISDSRLNDMRVRKALASGETGRACALFRAIAGEEEAKEWLEGDFILPMRALCQFLEGHVGAAQMMADLMQEQGRGPEALFPLLMEASRAKAKDSALPEAAPAPAALPEAAPAAALPEAASLPEAAAPETAPPPAPAAPTPAAGTLAAGSLPILLPDQIDEIILILSRAARISFSADIAARAAPSLLPSLMRDETLPFDLRIMAGARGWARGILPLKRLSPLFREHFGEPLPAGAGAEERAIQLEDALKKARRLSPTVYLAALRVYMRYLRRIPPSRSLAWFAPLAAHAFLLTGENSRLARWMRTTQADSDAPSEDQSALMRRAALLLWSEAEGEAARALTPPSTQRRDALSVALRFLSPGLGRLVPRVSSRRGRAGGRSAVIPIARLKDAAQEGRRGETVFRALILLDRQNLAATPPALLRQILFALRNAKLDALARALAVEVALTHAL